MEALLSVSDNVGHYEAIDKKDRYIVWAEDGEYNSFDANNYKNGQTIEGTIDYFTKDEDDDDDTPNRIQIALNKARIGWRLNSVQYEDETQFVHYEWIFRVRKMYDEDGSQGAG